MADTEKITDNVCFLKEILKRIDVFPPLFVLPSVFISCDVG